MGGMFSGALAIFAGIAYMLSGTVLDPLQFVLLFNRAVFFGGRAGGNDLRRCSRGLLLLGRRDIGGHSRRGARPVCTFQDRSRIKWSGGCCSVAPRWGRGYRELVSVVVRSHLANGRAGIDVGWSWNGYRMWEQYDLDSRLKAPPHETPKRPKFPIWQP